MDPAELLLAYDSQLREDAEVVRATVVQQHGPLLWAQFDDGGLVTYRSLDGIGGAALDALIAATVEHFREATDVATVEWKTRGHDRPADLGQRLGELGFVAQEVETVMLGPAAALAVDVVIPRDVAIRRAGDGDDLLADVTRVSAMQASVFARDAARDVERVADQLARDPEHYQMWFAEVGDQVVGAGTLDIVRGTEFAGLWGGGVLAAYRGRGIYAALVSVRARAAVERGVRFMHSDCTAMSRPILERSGLVAVTTTTPYEWKRSG